MCNVRDTSWADEWPSNAFKIDYVRLYRPREQPFAVPPHSAPLPAAGGSGVQTLDGAAAAGGTAVRLSLGADVTLVLEDDPTAVANGSMAFAPIVFSTSAFTAGHDARAAAVPRSVAACLRDCHRAVGAAMVLACRGAPLILHHGSLCPIAVVGRCGCCTPRSRLRGAMRDAGAQRHAVHRRADVGAARPPHADAPREHFARSRRRSTGRRTWRTRLQRPAV